MYARHQTKTERCRDGTIDTMTDFDLLKLQVMVRNQSKSICCVGTVANGSRKILADFAAPTTMILTVLGIYK